MSVTKAIITAIVITASVPSFRRAGFGFTDTGTAFAKDEFTADQLKAIHAEKKLSVREMPSDAIPEGIDTAPLDRYLAHPATKAAQEEKAAAAKKTESTTAKAGTKASKDTGAENAGA
ncbi:HI1506-related protein [Alteromonas sp. AMM-1]|uniref:HI1506-related protein n=1 Tax=Alteromonas sp. AMM-1 TaxID=3394233 RepID=UPI0039A6DA83